MIAHIRGILLSKTPEFATVDVGGVGYELAIPVSNYYNLPETGVEVEFFVSTFIRDDAIKLYGFLTAIEKELFTLLITVTGVGPKLARNILSGAGIEELVKIIATGDVVALKALPGLGKKTSERLILELREKITALSALPAGASGAALSGLIDDGPSGGLYDDVVSALGNLGYKEGPSREAVKKVAVDSADGEDFERLFKAALRAMA
ncbi:Holliday junction ATP-dependent DNA helicase RuvA [hydrothermal vent metagenome]|uniref:Holliday junction ATP-dependent DNA helicase RuvA n=1 Tax=hydrothermal vent metagenome TaxID=652676 RepID=A0A3B0QZ18_9ZZZZ